jgi:hypothetical protein
VFGTNDLFSIADGSERIAPVFSLDHRVFIENAQRAGEFYHY